MVSNQQLDHLDGRLLGALADHPRIGMLELSRRLGVARGTAQSRLDKLLRAGVVAGFGPDLDLAAMGYEVEAFTTVDIAQGRLADVVEQLGRIPEVLEAHSISGPGDLHCRVAARTNSHLQQVINDLIEVDGVVRTATVIALSCQIPYRVIPLVEKTTSARRDTK